MIQFNEEQFAGLDCVRITNGLINLWVTTKVGPRIIGCSFVGRENLFAVLPDEKLTHSSGDTFYIRGGHRLWYAPESFATTYIPDNQPIQGEVHEGVLRVIQPVDVPTQIQKSFVIRLAPDQPQVMIEHKLTNLGRASTTLAPWAITQLKPGGVAILPQQTGKVDSDGLLPNRQLVLWPYSQVNAPFLHLGDQYIFVEASMEDGAFKIGFPNPKGWLAYAVDDVVFMKKAAYFPDALYFDLGSSSECYCCPGFLELETLGPSVDLAPGETTSHVEEWVLFKNIQFSLSEEEVARLIDPF